jgi:poly(3-hydroxybutyrate) depolymerase
LTFHKLVFLLAIAGLAMLPQMRAADTQMAQNFGRKQFVFEQGGKHVTVRYYIPEGFTADSRFLFVMHGVRRDGERYLNDWIPYADEGHFLLVVPEFSTIA